MLTDLEITLPTGFGVATYPAGATFGPRLMRDFEFVWMIEGNAVYRWGETVVEAPANSIILCRPGATDFFEWDTRQRTRHGYFHFHVTQCPSSWGDPTAWPLVRLPSADDILRPLFRHVLAWAGRGNELQCRLSIAHLLMAFLSGEIAASEVPRETWPLAVEKVWQHIHQRLESDPTAAISLTELAQVACITPEHLCRLFQSSIGHSPVETARLARLDRAAVLLARSNYAVGEIAHLCGFASAFHFTRCFKAAYGQSPAQLRKSIRAGATPPTPRLIRLSRDLH